MSSIAVQLPPSQFSRADALFQQYLTNIAHRVDRIFAGLLLFEWLAGVLVALVISPIAWEGTISHTHEHVYAALYLGGLIISFPLLMVWIAPGTPFSRHAVAAGQLLYSSLLIHLTGGRIETHFHIFGSLAFLALYRDWRVLITGSLIVAIDHSLRGMWWPQSVYAVALASPWRWMEHVGWVFFEDVVLILGIRQSRGEMRSIATREAALEEATRHAESADRAKGAFLAQMSHEIRTPMTAILGYADMMQLEGEAVEAVQAIRRNGRHLLTVLDDILDLSKIEADQMRIEITPVDVAELLRDVQHLMGPRASAKDLAMSLELHNLPRALLTDPVRLRQVVLNFVSNAIKFTDQGHVRIVAEFVPDPSSPDRSGTLSIRVTDTGIGLSPEQQSRLFKAFSQADDSHHRTYGGTGLGLVISKRLAQLLRGDVHVQSQLGAGSSFSIRCPVQCSDQLPQRLPLVANSPRAPMLRTTAVGKRILVIDDAPDNRRLLRRLLAQAGFQVDVSEDGAHGVTAAQAAINDHHPYDLILMDMLMPRMDGYEATRALRQQGYTGRIFALTAHASASDESKCRDAGCDDYIRKPFDCEALLQRIHDAVAEKKAAPADLPPAPCTR